MRNLLFAILTTFLAASLPAQSASVDSLSFLTSAEKESLLQKKEVSTIGSRIADLKYPFSGPWAQSMRTVWNNRTTTVAMEALYLFDVSAADASKRLVKVFNSINAVSTMEGLQYYSVSAGKMEPLILASYRVESAEKPQRLPDQTFTEVPSFLRSVIFQKDNKLGDGFTEMTFQRDPTQKDSAALTLTLKNLSGLNYGIFPLVDSGNFVMSFYLVPYQDKILVYATMGVKTASLFGLERSKDESFRNRMRALAGWLGTQIQKN